MGARVRIPAPSIVAVPRSDDVVFDDLPPGTFELPVHASIEVPAFAIILVRFPVTISLEIGVASPGIVRIVIVPPDAHFRAAACLGLVDDAHLFSPLLGTAVDGPRRMCERAICEASGEQADDEPDSDAKNLHVCHTDLLPKLRKNERPSLGGVD
jgi:hypothetical protein